MARISVIMSLYNEEIRYVDEAIESILRQTYKDFDLIIIVDNPNRIDFVSFLDGIKEKDSRLKYYVNSKNIGLALSMNKAALYSEGEYLARMDADDVSDLTRLEKELRIAEQTVADVIYTPAILMDNNENEISRTAFFNPTDLWEIIPFGNPLIHPSVLIKKKAFQDVGGYNNFFASQDYDLWMRLLLAGKIFYGIEEPLVKKRNQKTSITSSRTFVQMLSRRYISEMIARYAKTGDYSYKQKDYEEYLSDNHAYDRKKNNAINKGLNMLYSGIRIGGFGGTCRRIAAYFIAPELIKDIYIKIKHKKIWNEKVNN